MTSSPPTTEANTGDSKTTRRSVFEVIGLIISSGLVGGVVAGIATVYLTEQSSVRIENSRLAYEQKEKIVDQFDSSQDALLSKLTLFNNDLLAGKLVSPERRADVMQSLVQAQIATTDLEDIVPTKTRGLVDEYKKELNDLNDATQSANQAISLGLVFKSVSRLLPLHAEIADDTRASLRVRGFFGS